MGHGSHGMTFVLQNACGDRPSENFRLRSFKRSGTLQQLRYTM